MNEIILGSAVFTLIVLGLASLVLTVRAFLVPATDITVTVNETRRLDARNGQKLLGALSDGNIFLPSACGGVGTCGLCRITIVEGGDEALPTEVTKLSHREVVAGMRLACQMVLHKPIAIRVPDELLEVESLSVTLRSNRTVAPLIKELVLDLPPGATMHFGAGDFVQVTAPPFRIDFIDFDVAPEHETAWNHLNLRRLAAASRRPTTRAYSIANRPVDVERIVLNVRLALPPPRTDLPPGIVSSYLFGLKPGDTLSIAGPYPGFHALETNREMVFIGGGVGMAPLRAIIFDQLERVGTRRKMTFWYGARSRIELFYVDELDRLQESHDNFRWSVALSEPKPDDHWEGPVGFIHDVVYERYLKEHTAPEDCEYYLCGPPLMIKAVFSMLENLGVDRENILFDDFGG